MFVTDGPEAETLVIRTFGGFAVYVGAQAQPVRFVTQTAGALLVYLACQGRALGRDTLAELLWPERTQEQARTNLRTTLYRLRSQLDPYLLVTRQSVALNPNARIEVDAEEFERSLAQGQLGVAAALYRGDFLDGFYLDGSAAFDQWALLERERLRVLVLAAWQQLIGQMAAEGQLDAAIRGAQRLLQLDPLHEPTHRQLMRLLTQAGDRRAALAQFESCRQLLASELDLLPDETTAALYEQIRLGESEALTDTHSGRPLALPASPATPTSAPNRLPVHNLPPQPTPFIGREVEVANVERMLSNPDCRLLTLLGVGGIGKTRLAFESASRQSGAFAHGVWIVMLAPVADAGSLAVAIAQSLALPITSNDMAEELAAYLQPREVLLVLDNFEHLLEAAGLVAHLLQHAPCLKILVTSRERLYLREEWLLPVTGLSVAEGLLSEAGQLFVRSAQRVQPDFTGEGEKEAIAEICRQVVGMPLAVELAASWVRVMACAAIARQMTANLDLLTSELRNLPERHRSIRALFDGSWRLLTESEQTLLRRLSLFRGGWTLDEAAEMADATLVLLLGLVNKSLVSMRGQHRFDLHELVRQYAAEQLKGSGEEGLMRQRHYATYLQLYRTGEGQLYGPEVDAWLERLQPEQDNLRAALQWCFDDRRYEDAAWLLLATTIFWYYLGQWYEMSKWCTHLLPYRQNFPVALRLAILNDYCFSIGHVEDLRAVDSYRAELLELIELCPYKILQAEAWLRIAWSVPDSAQAGAAHARAVMLAREASEEPPIGAEFCRDGGFLLAAHQRSYGGFLIDQGEAEQATSLITDSLQHFRQQGNFSYIAHTLGCLGFLALLRGDLVEAKTLLGEILTISKTHNYPSLVAEWQPLLGLVALYSGNVVEARRLLEEAMRMAIEVKESTSLALASLCLAELALWEANPEQAADWLKQSLAYWPPRPRITIFEFQRLLAAARLATLQGDHRRAATLLGCTDAMHRYMHYAYNGLVLPLFQATVMTVAAAMGEGGFDEAFATGQGLSLDEVIATLLAITPHHIPQPG